MMKRSALEIREHLVKYIKKYDRAVKYVGKDFLTRKGLTLEDYLDFMSVPGNHGHYIWWPLLKTTFGTLEN